MKREVSVGIIGGGLMGREAAAAFGRWFSLNDYPVTPRLVAVADTSESALNWFRNVPGVEALVTSYEDLLALKHIDLVYAAVPHHLHEQVYIDVLESGKDLLAEKPFGIDLAAAQRIIRSVASTGRFVRVSSEFPFMPGAQRAISIAKAENFGQVLEIRSGFLHSSDLDFSKPANWKRQSKTCGAIGAMGDLGMHVVHVPLRLGWTIRRLFAQLQFGPYERPDGKGGVAACDTPDNALMQTDASRDGVEVPLRLETKRLAPGETNTWYLEILGVDHGVRYSTKFPKTLSTFQRGRDQSWNQIDTGSVSVFPTITGQIFEFGFTDCLLQMWAAFLAERDGFLGDRFGCARPEEALESQRVFSAALQSHHLKQVVAVDDRW